MANYASLKATIDAQIKANGNQEITGPILNAVLTAMINTIGNGYALQGSVAQPGDNPGAPDNPVAYLAAGPGTYTNFGGTVIPDDGHAYLLTWDTSWHAVQLPLATFDLANGKQDALTFDDEPTQGSDNPVKSGGIYDKLALKADKSTTYTKTETDNRLNDKVDKEAGKGLSSNDYTDGEKAKLGALPTAAELSTDLAAKQDKDTGDTAGHVAVMDGNGNSVDGGEALADLATKEDVEAVEQEVAQIAGEAGLAEAVIDTDGAGTEQEFTFRKSGGDGGAYYRKIKGKTVVWNQLVNQLATPVVSGDAAHLTATKEVDGRIKIVLSAPVSSLTQITFADPITAFYKAGHRYFLSLRQSNNLTPYLAYSGGNGVWWQQTPSNLATLSQLWTVTTTTDAIFTIYVGASLPAGTYYVYPQVVDLTLAGLDEVSTVADFDAIYPNPFPYTPGTPISNDAEAVETTGVNQWDEEWEAGKGINPSTGEIIDDPTCCVSKNFIPVLGGVAYYSQNASWANRRIGCYDADKNFISFVYDSGNGAFTTPSNCAYLLFFWNGPTYNHDICINLSNPEINGQYFPYWKRTLQLGITTRKDTDGNVPFADGMKGAGTAADWADKVGGEKIMGRVKFSDLTFERASTNVEGKYRFRAAIPTAKNAGAGICSKYARVASTATADETGFTIASSSHNLYIYDEAYSTATAEAFAAAVANEYLDFELDTPVPFTWAEPLNLGVKVDENGTERAVAPEGATAPSAPFVADTTYTMSIARMVAKLQSI